MLSGKLKRLVRAVQRDTVTFGSGRGKNRQAFKKTIIWPGFKNIKILFMLPTAGINCALLATLRSAREPRLIMVGGKAIHNSRRTYFSNGTHYALLRREFQHQRYI
ncbi:MAG: hypothetical protein JWQ40_48 [Segetibacter sp.]|nr:hypothetical protein [Segetibacter sp.]